MFPSIRTSYNITSNLYKGQNGSRACPLLRQLQFILALFHSRFVFHKALINLDYNSKLQEVASLPSWRLLNVLFQHIHVSTTDTKCLFKWWGNYMASTFIPEFQSFFFGEVTNNYVLKRMLPIAISGQAMMIEAITAS